MAIAAHTKPLAGFGNSGTVRQGLINQEWPPCLLFCIMHSMDEETSEQGSDELLSANNLHLPASANILVRLHAVRAWLTRRQEEASIDVGEAALELQETMMATPTSGMLRRRQRLEMEERLRHIQQRLAVAQQRLHAYEEAQSLLEECIDHTAGERILVEYYLSLEELVLTSTRSDLPDHPENRAWLEVMADVQHRIERVGAPDVEEG